MFGSFQIRLFSGLNASNRNCGVLLAMRKLPMIDASTLVMPGPRNVLRPPLPQAPRSFNANALVLNHF